MDMEQKLHEFISQSKEEYASMKYYDETRPLYLETDESRVGVMAGLLQNIDRRNFPWDKAPDKTMLRPVAFAAKAYPLQSISIETLPQTISN